MRLKSYYLNKYNFFTSKFQKRTTFAVPKEVLMDKVVECINDSRFKIRQMDKAKSRIFATSPISFQSWGENIYMDFIAEKDKTILEFSSVTISQLYAWGKNEKNYNEFIDKLEKSLASF